MTSPEIASDTDELRGQAGQLRAQAEALDAALANMESMSGTVRSESDRFVPKHEPRAVYMEKTAELGTMNNSVKTVITSLAGQLRAQADGLTSHAASKDEQEEDSAGQMDKLPDDVGTPQPHTAPSAPQPSMPAVAV